MIDELPPGPPVPDAYLGVWKRTLLRTPTIEDTTTQVYWMQTRSWHADVRVPASRPACSGKTSLDELTRDELTGLARQQGFCGTTLVQGDICRWLRRHDFQPPSGANDIGRMEFETPDRVLEYGVEADYFEIWERVPGSTGGDFAHRVSAHLPTFLLGTGEFRMRVRPRAGALATASSMSTLAVGRSDADVRGWLDFEISFGRLRDSGTWRIQHSTLPWLEGNDVRAG